MLKKSYSKTSKVCRVTFRLPADVNAETASLCAEFNDWDPSAHPMKKLKSGDFSATVTLDAGKSYRFRYYLDGERWENDWDADDYVANDFFTEDSVVEV